MSIRKVLIRQLNGNPVVEPVSGVDDMLDALELMRAEQFEREAKRTVQFVRAIAKEARLVEEAI